MNMSNNTYVIIVFANEVHKVWHLHIILYEKLV